MKRKEETDRTNGKKDCNLLYNMKERKSGAKPEGIRKSKRLYYLAQKCIRKSLGFPAIGDEMRCEVFHSANSCFVTLRKQNEEEKLKGGMD